MAVNTDEKYRAKIRKLRTTIVEQDALIDLLQEDLGYLNTFRCSKCGHYTMRGFVCHVCGKDPTI